MFQAAYDLASYVLRLPAPKVPEPSPPRTSWLLGHYPDMQAALTDGSFSGLLTCWARTYAPRGATFLAVPGGERWVIVTNDKVIAAIYRDPDGDFGKTQAWVNSISILAPLSLVPIEGATWRRHRKLVAHAFSFRHLILAGQQGDVSCRRLIRGLAAGAREDTTLAARVAKFNAAECFMAVFLDVQGACNLRADFEGVSHYLSGHGYPSGIPEGVSDPLAVAGVSRIPPPAEGEIVEGGGMLAVSDEFSGILQRLFGSPKPLWGLALPRGTLDRAAQLRTYMRSIARRVLAARRESGGGSAAAAAAGSFTDLADMLLAAEGGAESHASNILAESHTSNIPGAPANPISVPCPSDSSSSLRRGEGSLTMDEVVDDTVALMWAATETSGSTMGWLML